MPYVTLKNGNRIEALDEFTGESKSFEFDTENKKVLADFGDGSEPEQIGGMEPEQVEALNQAVDDIAQLKIDVARAETKADIAGEVANSKLDNSMHSHTEGKVPVANENGQLVDSYITNANIATNAGIETSKLAFTSKQIEVLNSGINSAKVVQIQTNSENISLVESTANHADSEAERIGKLIPSTASESNQLADKNFVNSSIATSTATFRGTFNSFAELEAYSGEKDDNDYAFVAETSGSATVYKRYKYNGSTWEFEYQLNNSSFTSQQWATINSGLTSQSALDIAANTSAINTLNGNSSVSGSVDNKIASAMNGLGDGETIGSNDNSKLEAIAVKEKNKNLTLPIWHGSKEEWLGEPDTWYSYTRGNQNSFSLTNGQYRPTDYHSYEEGDPVNFYAPLGCVYYDSTRVGLSMTSDKKVRLTTANIGQNSSSITSSTVSTDTLPDDISYNMQQAFIPYGTNGGYFYNKQSLLEEDNVTLVIAKGSLTSTSGMYGNEYGINITPIRIDVTSIVSGSNRYYFNLVMMRQFNGSLCIFTDSGLIKRVSDSEWTVTPYNLTSLGENETRITNMGGLYVSNNVVYTTCKLDIASGSPYFLIKSTDGYTWEKVKEVPGFIFDDNGSVVSGCLLSTDSDSDVFGYYTTDFEKFTELAYQLNDGLKISDYIFANADTGTHYIGINQQSHYDSEAQQSVITTRFVWTDSSRLNWYGMSVDGLKNTSYLTGGTAGYRNPLVAFFYNSSFSYGNYYPIIIGGGTYYILAKYMRKGGKEMYVHSAEPKAGDQIYMLPFKEEIGNKVKNYNAGSSFQQASISTNQNTSFTANSSGNKNFYTTVSDTHPEYACLIDGDMLVIGNKVVANNIKASTGIIMDNGSISVKDYSKLLKNGSSKGLSLSIGNNNDTGQCCMAIGYSASTDSETENLALGVYAKAKHRSVAIGSASVKENSVQATGTFSTSIGTFTSATGSYSVALGSYSKATAYNAYQIGNGTNSTSNSLQVGNYTLLNTSTGKVPLERLADSPSSATFLRGDGTWATPDSGVIVDQVYNAESVNAQSGKAIAGAGFASASSLATVATTGSYTDLSNTPNLATVATTGSYSDLSNKPTIPVVDQSYSASSSNAQSGVAVAQAIASAGSAAKSDCFVRTITYQLSNWTDTSDSGLSATYPKQATNTIELLTIPYNASNKVSAYVSFSGADAISGKYAPVAKVESINTNPNQGARITIYATEVPSTQPTIDVTVFLEYGA